jgi:nucleoside-diphosphate-sugar epimerase
MHAPSEKRAFVAGSSGVIGTILCQLLLEDGWQIVGTTRSRETATRLQALGVQPEVVDVFDREALIRAVCAAKPHVVVHQLTDLPKTFTPEAMAAARERNARIREVGTDNLVAAAVASGAKRLVAQSIAFAYASGQTPLSEEASLDASAFPSVIKLEQLVVESGLEGIVLRYGRLYGPGTWTLDPPDQAPVHVDAAAAAARQAMTLGQTGVYNIVEDGDTVINTKAKLELHWNPYFRNHGHHES